MTSLISHGKGIVGFRERFLIQFVNFTLFHPTHALSIQMSKHKQASFSSICITEQVQWSTWPGQRQGKGGNQGTGKRLTRSWTRCYICYFYFIPEISVTRTRVASPSGPAWKGSSGNNREKEKAAWSVHHKSKTKTYALFFKALVLKYLTPCSSEI